LGAPPATSAWLLGISHSFQLASPHEAVPERSQTVPPGQAVVAEIVVQPLAPAEQDPRLLLEKQDVVPAVQAFVQQDAEPAAPVQAPLVQVLVVAVVQPLVPSTHV
jgi:hypothetical protein